MLQEAAETLLSLTSFVTPTLNENDLYTLIGTGVEALQKSAFVLLKSLYENYIPVLKFKIADSDMVAQVKLEALNTEQQEKLEAEEVKGKGGEIHKHHDHEKIKNKLAFRNISDVLI